MNNRGQVFTLDMIYALIIVALIIGCSGKAFEMAVNRTDSYSARYSLERTANDAADVLVKTLGRPVNWEENTETLETPGFAEENEGNPVPNTISLMKFGQLRRLTNSDNWVAPANASAVEAIKKLFGGSEDFEIRILDENGNELWHAFPGWVPGENSGAENSLEVAVVRRLVAVKYGSAIEADSGRIAARAPGGDKIEENLEFEIYPGELDAFDWYIVVAGDGNPNLSMTVNDNKSAPADYNFTKADTPQEIYPKKPPGTHTVNHGGIENDDDINAENQLHEGTNFIHLYLPPAASSWVRVYVVAVPFCSARETAAIMVQSLSATLEVKMWR